MTVKLIKPVLADIKIICHFYKLAHQISKTYIPLLFTSALLKALVPFINIIMPKFIIDELMGAQRVDVLVPLVCVVAMGNMVLNALNRYFEMVINVKNHEVLQQFDWVVGQKIMNLDFEKIEDPLVLDLKERALFPIKNQGALARLIQSGATIINIVIMLAILTVVISMLNPLIIVVVLFIVLLNTALNKKMQHLTYEFHQLLIPLNRKFGYYANLTSDFTMAKDVRLYELSPLIMGKIDQYNQESLSWFAKLYQMLGKYTGISQINMQIQMIVVYAYMTYRVFIESISIGDFTMYVNAANQFSSCLQQFGMTYVELTQLCRYLDQYLEFEKIESKNAMGIEQIEPAKNYTIEFRNVYFKYPRAQHFVLENVNITILPGEKLSVVGLNGAGKTTFIKLLTRLYEPTKGEILLNGKNIADFSYESYMKMLSVVFQDFKLLAFSVKENVSFEVSPDVSDDVILEVLRQSGLGEDVSKLKHGLHTSLYKTFDEDGVEFSGGMAQKLAISRAMY
ncbi:MAG: ATP-binding cassette domain-containing protein, partial [Turicibacter sp.]